MIYIQFKAYNISVAAIMAVILTIAMTLLAGCEADRDFNRNDNTDPSSEKTVTISMHLSAAEAYSTRGDGIEINPICDNEKIRYWWIIFVGNDNKVAKILNRTDVETEISDAGATESEYFNCEIQTGTYDIYAFANITPTQLTEATGFSFTLNGSVGDVENATWTSDLNNWDIDNNAIPMTGFLKGLEVLNEGESFSIEVVRMVAKIEYQLSTYDGCAFTVSEVSLNPVTTSAVSLFPKGKTGISLGHLGESAYTPLSGAISGVCKVGVQKSLTAKNDTNHPESVTFYTKESISNYINGKAFTVGVKVRHEEGVSEFQQYGLTKGNILSGYINRNDWIRIPLTLSRYDVKVKALFYPPIGGYPAVQTRFDNDGMQIFTFGTQGFFSIVTEVTDKTTAEILPPEKYSVTIDPDSFKDVSGIIKDGYRALNIENNQYLPHDISGMLTTKQGTASMRLDVNIFDETIGESGEKNIAQTYSRDIFIYKNEK